MDKTKEKYTAINWREKSPEEIYKFHGEIEEESEALEFVAYLLNNYPEAELAWIDMFTDSMYPLLEAGGLQQVVDFAELYRKVIPDEYRHYYGFVERELISHYLYQNNIPGVLSRLEIVKLEPAVGFNEVTDNAMFQLIYHGYPELAYQYAVDVWKPLYEDEKHFGDLHAHFSVTIYLYKLEHLYRQLRKGETPDVAAFKKEMDSYGFDETEAYYENIVKVLSCEPQYDQIMELISVNPIEGLVNLNLHFCKYMYDEYSVAFMLSDRFWNSLNVPDLFGSVKEEGAYFYVPYLRLEEHFGDQHRGFFSDNILEIFGKVWGLQYPYAFLHKAGLIDDVHYEMMVENIRELRYHYLDQLSTPLWQVNFVFKWPAIGYCDPYEQMLFNDSYTDSKDESNRKMEEYLTSRPTIVRIESEMPSKRKQTFIDDYETPQPMIRTEPKTGRNDPCPCGSGLKYKKCCLN